MNAVSCYRVDDDRGRLLASMFLDQGLWERRLHFAGGLLPLIPFA